MNALFVTSTTVNHRAISNNEQRQIIQSRLDLLAAFVQLGGGAEGTRTIVQSGGRAKGTEHSTINRDCRANESLVITPTSWWCAVTEVSKLSPEPQRPQKCDDPLKKNTQQSIGVKWKREGSTTVEVMTVHPNHYKEVEQKTHEQYLPIRRPSKRHEKYWISCVDVTTDDKDAGYYIGNKMRIYTTISPCRM